MSFFFSELSASCFFSSSLVFSFSSYLSSLFSSGFFSSSFLSSSFSFEAASPSNFYKEISVLILETHLYASDLRLHGLILLVLAVVKRVERLLVLTKSAHGYRLAEKGLVIHRRAVSENINSLQRFPKVELTAFASK